MNQIKKAILTGGGRGTRLFPVTTNVNKHLLPLANKPMIYHAIERVVEAGVEEIFINTNPGETSLPEHIGDGSQWGISITYFEQTGGPQGIAHVVNEAKKFIGDDPFMFYLSDNILLSGVKELVDEFTANDHDCMIALSEVPDPERFGVPVFDDNGVLVRVDEKPEHPASNFAVTGIYIYGSGVFFDAFDHIDKSARGEYEISDIHTYLLEQGKSVGYKEITGWWKDTGKPLDLLLANTLLLEGMVADDFTIACDGATCTGNVSIGEGAHIGENVVIQGPVMIGAHATLENCTIGPYVTLGEHANIANTTIGNSIALSHVTVHGMSITDSIFGKGATVRNEQKKDQHMILGERTVLEL